MLAGCADDFSKPPDITEPGSGKTVACVVNGVCNKKLSAGACELMSGEQLASCPNPSSEIKNFELNIINDRWLFVRGYVSLKDSSMALDSVKVSSTAPGVNISYDKNPVAGKYNFYDRVRGIDLRDSAIKCGENYNVCVNVFIAGNDVSDTHCKNFKKPSSLCNKPSDPALAAPTISGDYNFPDFTCKWSRDSASYGQMATPQMTGTSDCEKKMYYVSSGRDTTWLTLDSSRTLAGGVFSNTVSTVTVRGVIHCSYAATGQEGILNKNCNGIKITPTPPPNNVSGKISFKENYSEGDSLFFFAGVKAKDSVVSSVLIGDWEDALCDSAKPVIVVEGLTNNLTVSGQTVKAYAVATCNGTDFVLDSAEAHVLPDLDVGECALTGSSKATMRSDQTLTVNLAVSNSYGRCDEVEYSFSGNTWQSDGAFSLSGLGNETVNPKARCKGSQNSKNCPAVSVALFRELKCTGNDNRSLTFDKGKTIVEFSCDQKKGDYYISCEYPSRPNNETYNFTVEIEGYKEGNSENDIRKNGGDNGYNFPNLEPTQLSENLYLYPEEIVVKTEQQGLKCGMW